MGGRPIRTGFFFAAAALMLAMLCSASAASTVTRSFSTATPAQCSNLTVFLAVSVDPADATSATDYYAIDELAPAGWPVLGANGSGDYASQPSRVTWVVIAGAATTTYQYVVGVPCGATAGVFTGEYGFSGNPTATVGGRSELAVAPATTGATGGSTGGSQYVQSQPQSAQAAQAGLQAAPATEATSDEATLALDGAAWEIDSAQVKGKNVSAAASMLDKAKSAFASMDFAQASWLAGQAKSMALAAQPQQVAAGDATAGWIPPAIIGILAIGVGGYLLWRNRQTPRSPA